MPETNLVLFQKRIPGKWILAGEHSVLRGGKALVFPLSSQYLEIFYFKANSALKIDLQGVNSNEISKVVFSVFEKAFVKLNLKQHQLSGRVHLKSNILFGAGMGASATLCVAVTYFFNFLGYVKDSEMYDFARELENIFHGESSGVDVAVVLRQRPLIFSRNEPVIELSQPALPKLYLSHTGSQGITKDCVNQVKKLWQKDPVAAAEIDARMNEAVQQFLELLHVPTPEKWIAPLQKAHSCFASWGLINSKVQMHEQVLLSHGALAVKLTGSGAGGYMLSLWKDKPVDLPFALIDCAENVTKREIK